jgi:nucleotide-binding universal stress UspA family protein
MNFKRLLLTLDGSDDAWRALPLADDLATRLGVPLELLHVAAQPSDVEAMRRQIETGLARHQLRGPAPTVTVQPELRSSAATIAAHAAGVAGTLLVMETAGRRRSAGVLGSVTTDVLRMTNGPVVAVGTHAATQGLSDRDQVVIPLDGSSFSEAAVPVGVALAAALGARPWVVTNVDPHTSPVAGVLDSNYPRAMAQRVAGLIGRDAEYETLHEPRPAHAVTNFAATINAGLIVCSTHGRTGWGRLAVGSVAASIVHEAPCPVVLVRPPTLPPLQYAELGDAVADTPPASGR